MPFFRREFQDILTDTIQDLSQNTNITRLSPGSKARAILEAFAKRLEEAYGLFDLNLARAFVSSAPGQFLDLIGELLGVSRESSVAASVDEGMQIIEFSVDGGGTFGSINGGQDIILPAGTVRLSTKTSGNGIVYLIGETVVLLSDQTKDYVAAYSLTPGEDSNIGTGFLVYHNFTGYSDSNNETLLVTNRHAISNGKNFESDSNFRFRIVNRVLEAEAANQTAVRLAALSTPGVANVILIKHYRGISTFGVIIKSVSPTVSQNLINNVLFNIERVVALGDQVFVRGPKETGFSMRTTIHYSSRLPTEEMDAIEELLIEVIISFINNLDIGEAFNLNRLVSEMFNVSENIINLGTAGKPIDEIFIHVPSSVQDNKIKQTLLGDYSTETDERLIIEPTVSSPITFARSFTRN